MTEAAMLADLARLVAVPSGNPPCDNERIARCAADLLRRRTGKVPRIERVAPGKFNVLLRLGEPRAVWNVHLDTVPAGSGWTRPPHRLTREGDRLYGLGACDTKGALAAMLAALGEPVRVRRGSAARRAGQGSRLECGAEAPHGGEAREPVGVRRGSAARGGGAQAEARAFGRTPNLLILLTCDEEAGPGDCIPAFLRHPWRRGIEWGIVSEPTGCRVVTAHRAIYSVRAEFRGRTAHASRPGRGRNAIDAAAAFIAALPPLRRRLARRTGAGFRGSILNVGTIEGGIKTNMVADRCIVRIGRRTLPCEGRREVVEEIDRVARPAARRFGCGVRVECTFAGPGLDLSSAVGRALRPRLSGAGRDLVASVADPARRLRVAGAGREMSVDFWTEASLLTRAGIPSAVFGPGRIAQAHAPDEYLSVGQLRHASAVFASILHDLS